jgi:uncharacterized protein YxeA
MRKILYLSFLSLFFPMAVQAQTPPPKKKPAKEAPKTDSQKEAKESVDLDAFFKKGEENAETLSCDKPAKPADPIA